MSSCLLVQYIQDVALVTINQSSVIEARDIEHIRAELDSLVDNQGKTRLVLDLSKVQLLSSSALGVLIPLQQKFAKIKGGKLILCGVRSDIRRVFKITKLDKHFQFAKDEAKALSKLGVEMPA